MLIYFLQLIIPFLFYYVCINPRIRNRHTVLIGLGADNEHHNMSLPIFFGMLLILLMCRGESVGNDTRNYHYIFDKNAVLSVSNIFSELEESLFSFFNFLLYNISDNYRIYLIITALIEIIPIAYYYCKDRRHSLLKIALFVNMSTYIMLFSGIRQAMAISLGVMAFYSLIKSKKLRFWIISMVAFFIHTSAFMLFLMYPLFYFRFKKKHLLIIVPLMLVIFVFNRSVFTFLTGVFSLFSDKFNTDISQTGAVTMLFLFVAFVVFAYVIGDESKMDYESFALRNILLFAVLVQCFAPLHTLAMRMNYYFIIFIPVCMGKSITFCKKAYLNIARYAEIVMVIFFTGYFCYTVTMEYVTGNSVLNTVPYIPFWAE